MRTGMAFYLGMTATRDRGPAHCCSDEPLPPGRTSRSPAPGRWIRKVSSALPTALTVFREALRLPLVGSRPVVGSRVLLSTGRTLGRVEELMIGVETGRATYAIAATGDEARYGRVLLLPGEALRSGPEADVLVVDERSIDRRLRRVAEIVRRSN